MSTNRLEQTAALRRLAENATPGPWHVEYAGDLGGKYAHIGEVLRERYGKNALSFGEDHATAEYVAALDPTTVIALLDRLDRVEAVLARWGCNCGGPSPEGRHEMFCDSHYGDALAAALTTATEERHQ